MRLNDFVMDKQSGDKVFGLKPSCVTMQIKRIARRAGLENLHAHTLRHKAAQDLLESGADIRTVQEILGHGNVSTTQVYLSVRDKAKREAINRLEAPAKSSPGKQPLSPQQASKIPKYYVEGQPKPFCMSWEEPIPIPPDHPMLRSY